jgi:hypothetical protein
MAARRGATRALEHALARHELAIIFADRACGGAEARIGEIGAHRPFPDIAEHLPQPGLSPVARRTRADGACFVELVAAGGVAASRRRLPFPLGRQPRARPAGKSVGLIMADLACRRGGVDRMQTIQREGGPVRTVMTPVERGLDAVRVHPVPAVRQPQLRPAIAAVVHEGSPLAVGDGPVGERVGVKQHRMARPLAIEGEVAAIMADLDDPARPLHPADRFGRGDGDVAWLVPHCGRERVFGEGGQHVGEHQLLMLLLMMGAEQDQRPRFLVQRRQRIGQRGIDMRAPCQHRLERGATEHTAPRPGMAGALALIIAVEQIGVALVMEPVAWHLITQHEAFEEPGSVRQVPFRGRCVRHRLDGGVGVRKRGRDRLAQRPHPAKPALQSVDRQGRFRLRSQSKPLPLCRGDQPSAPRMVARGALTRSLSKGGQASPRSARRAGLPENIALARAVQMAAKHEQVV